MQEKIELILIAYLLLYITEKIKMLSFNCTFTVYMRTNFKNSLFANNFTAFDY